MVLRRLTVAVAFVVVSLSGIVPGAEFLPSASNEAEACSASGFSLKMISPDEETTLPPDPYFTFGYDGVTANNEPTDVSFKLKNGQGKRADLERLRSIPYGIVGSYIRFKPVQPLDPGTWTLVVTVAMRSGAGGDAVGTGDAGADAGGAQPVRRFERTYTVESSEGIAPTPFFPGLSGAAARLEGEAAFCQPGPKARVQFQREGDVTPAFGIARFKKDGETTRAIIPAEELADKQVDATVDAGVMPDCISVSLVGPVGTQTIFKETCDVRDCGTISGAQWRGETDWSAICPSKVDSADTADEYDEIGGGCQTSRGAPVPLSLVVVTLIGFAAGRRRNGSQR